MPGHQPGLRLALVQDGGRDDQLEGAAERKAFIAPVLECLARGRVDQGHADAALGARFQRGEFLRQRGGLGGRPGGK
ncbi:hypothetical protein SDC9_183543 [bioreactor metagenome]|uniref:Uncharacterized protein n=1 Tax=bioreactor metagenome TaxID=1076179 RepID=A0A645HAI6_9ZZZZ